MLDMDGALQVMERLEDLNSDVLNVRPERCVCVRNRHASCRRCSEACTSHAISVIDNKLVIDQEKCVGCGTCATVCPTCALEIRHPNDVTLQTNALRSARMTGGVACFSCATALPEMDPELARMCVSTVCLSRIEESLAVGLFDQGVKQILAVKGACEGCPRHDGCKSIDLVCRTMGTLMDAWHIPCRYDVVGFEEGCEELRQLSKRPTATDAAVPASSRPPTQTPPAKPRHEPEKPRSLAHVMADGTLPHFVPERREVLLDHLASFGDPDVDIIDTRLWGHVTINEDLCRSCRMCTVFCPTGALARFDTDDGMMGVDHYVAECVHCKLCEDICPEHAIVSSSKVPALQLAHGQVEKYTMKHPAWEPGRRQIVRKMQMKIGGDSVDASYGE
jgi:Fe-S-cluster-containing hydrogenase component 2